MGSVLNGTGLKEHYTTPRRIIGGIIKKVTSSESAEKKGLILAVGRDKDRIESAAERHDMVKRAEVIDADWLAKRGRRGELYVLNIKCQVLSFGAPIGARRGGGLFLL